MSNYLLLEKLKRFVDERSGGIERMAGDSNKDLRHEIATEILGHKSKSTDISLTAIVSALVTKLGGDPALMARIEQESFIRKAVHPRANDVNVGSETSPVQIYGQDGFRENGFWFMKSPLGGPMGGNFIRELAPGRSAALDAAWAKHRPDIADMARVVIGKAYGGPVEVVSVREVDGPEIEIKTQEGVWTLAPGPGFFISVTSPEGVMSQVKHHETTDRPHGGLPMDCQPPGWSVFDPEKADPFDPWGVHPYTSVYERTIGGDGYPTCALTVLREGNIYRPAHGPIVMADRVGTAKAAAVIAMTWAVENGFSNSELLGVTLVAQNKVPDNFVNDGRYNGRVLEVGNGVVVQRIDREGNTVRHDASKLSKAVEVGGVADIQYAAGIGVVLGKTVALER